MKKILNIIFVLMLMFLIVGCKESKPTDDIQDDPIDDEPKVEDYAQIDINDFLSQGEVIKLNVNSNISIPNDLKWEASNDKVIIKDGYLLANTLGNVDIKLSSEENELFNIEKEITIKKYVAEEEDEELMNKVEEILNNMSLEQKIGQMFTIGFTGTTYNDTLKKAIEEYHFGNIIYMGGNVSDPSTISKMTYDIQNEMMKQNGIAAFISIDQEGGNVARIKNGGTHFISQMAMGATGDYNNTYLEGKAMGAELRHYGINCDYSPVMDVNNNPANPIIGIRSYSDNPVNVSLYGVNMFKGLEESNVMGCSKHFPGHGNTSTDSHLGLPTITSPKEELYKTELAPFIASISNGIDAIMTTHIVFTAFDSEYPATLSKKVLTGLLREELGYTGLIVTDGMQMGAISKNYGSYEEIGVMGVNAGVDIFTFTSNDVPRQSYKGILDAVNNGEISVERINESVRRIIAKKLKYNVNDYKQDSSNIDDLLKENENLNNEFASSAITCINYRAKDDFSGLDKNLKTLIVSPTSSLLNGMGLKESSFACYAYEYLTDLGFDVTYKTVTDTLTNAEIEELMKLVDDSTQIVLAFGNVTKDKKTNVSSFVNGVAKKENKKLMVIALESPYDMKSYSFKMDYYVCTYYHQKATSIALAKFLSGERKATGILPISKDSIE